MMTGLISTELDDPSWPQAKQRGLVYRTQVSTQLLVWFVCSSMSLQSASAITLDLITLCASNSIAGQRVSLIVMRRSICRQAPEFVQELKSLSTAVQLQYQTTVIADLLAMETEFESSSPHVKASRHCSLGFNATLSRFAHPGETFSVNPRSQTPRLHKLPSRAFVFPNHYSTPAENVNKGRPAASPSLSSSHSSHITFTTKLNSNMYLAPGRRTPSRRGTALPIFHSLFYPK